MSRDITKNLLESYYGFGEINNDAKYLASHMSFNYSCPDEKNISSNGNNNKYLSNDNFDGVNQSLEINVQDLEDQDGPDDQPQRSWRAILDDDKLDEDETESKDDDPISSESKNPLKTQIPDEIKNFNSTLKVSDKGEVRDDALQLGILEDNIPDSASDISSMSMKKKIKKKPKIISPKSNLSEPVILLPPVHKKVPIITESFCDMTNSSLDIFPLNFLSKVTNIRMMYLDRNLLAELPEDFFTTLRLLQWLDIRNNRLKIISASIKNHPCLETILLQGNLLQRLPLELCTLKKLKTLQTVGNPLDFPPINIVSQGFLVVMNFLRMEWNKVYPNEQVYFLEDSEIKSSSTILCSNPPTLSKKKSSRSTRNFRFISSPSSATINSSKKFLTTREKSKNYRPSNRCESTGYNSILEEKLNWILKIKEILGKQSDFLQRKKDQDALRDWRQENKSFEKSMKKASLRTEDDIPFGIDVNELPFKNRKTKNPEKKKNVKFKKNYDIDAEISEIFDSLKFSGNKEENMTSQGSNYQLDILQSEIRKIEELYAKIQELKKQNATFISTNYRGPNIPTKSEIYKKLPSMII